MSNDTAEKLQAFAMFCILAGVLLLTNKKCDYDHDVRIKEIEVDVIKVKQHEPQVIK